MKLIRDTASFKNMIYVAAYDKTFVSSTIENYGIKNAVEYMRKIFPLEITLPALPLGFIPDLLQRCLSLNLPSGSTSIINKLDYTIYTYYNGEHLVTSFLKKQRDVVNFSMQYVMAVSPFIENDTKIKEIDVVDLFWLELIHYCNTSLYERLENINDSLFTKDKHWPYNVDEITIDSKSETYKQLTESEKTILGLLFPQKYSQKPFHNSLRSVDNHYKYFTFHISAGDILSSEYLSLIRGKQDIKEWFEYREKRKRIPIRKLLFFSNIINTKQLDCEQGCRYIDLLIVWSTKAWNNGISELFSRKLFLGKDNWAQFKEHLYKGHLSAIDNANVDTLIHMQQDLTALCNIANYYEQHPDSEEPLLDRDDISSIEKPLWEKFNDYLPILKPAQILKDGRVKTLLQCSVTTDRTYEDINETSSLLMDKVTNKLSIEPASATEYHVFSKQIKPQIDDELAETEPAYIDIIHEKFSNELCSIFGNITTFKKFLSQCFEVEENVLKKDFPSIFSN